jgi:hypothetical protein
VTVEAGSASPVDRRARARRYGDLRALIAHDCPKMQKPSSDIYDGCGVHFPELPKWF